MLEASKTSDRGAPTRVGDVVSYTITVSNRGNAPAYDVAIQDRIAADVELDFGSVQLNGSAVSGNYSDGVLTVEVGTLAADETASLTFQVTVLSTALGKSIENTGLIQGSREEGGDPDIEEEITDGNTEEVEEPLVAYTLVDVTYRANGGTGTHIVDGLFSGEPYTVLGLSETGISREGYSFTSWNTKADGTGIAYRSGDIITLEDDLMLYAQWKVNSTGGGGETTSYKKKLSRPNDGRASFYFSAFSYLFSIAAQSGFF